jgi:hypothetical protein
MESSGPIRNKNEMKNFIARLKAESEEPQLGAASQQLSAKY